MTWEFVDTWALSYSFTKNTISAIALWAFKKKQQKNKADKHGMRHCSYIKNIGRVLSCNKLLTDLRLGIVF